MPKLFLLFCIYQFIFYYFVFISLFCIIFYLLINYILVILLLYKSTYFSTITAFVFLIFI